MLSREGLHSPTRISRYGRLANAQREWMTWSMEEKLSFFSSILEHLPASTDGFGPDLGMIINMLHYMLVLFGPQLFFKLAEECISINFSSC